MAHIRQTSQGEERTLLTEELFQKLLKMPGLTQQSSQKIKMPPTPAEEPNRSPVTQFIPRSVQLATNAKPPTQEVFFKQMSQMMSSMMNSFFSQMANYYQSPLKLILMPTFQP
ncbi:hypothetical protein AVEN_48571-1 [Araneus ventricosus]|uniref:Uncharacterized protein n=1 Tax=Araneus ventricosus TaxID=182803 RepID=A0A4Y2QKD2_ARAVE|nr:hypothetical protein AVEN_48571-1 [Araneus ventricosus]